MNHINGIPVTVAITPLFFVPPCFWPSLTGRRGHAGARFHSRDPIQRAHGAADQFRHIRGLLQLSCVDGAQLARGLLSFCEVVGCGHVSGLLMRLRRRWP